MADLTLGMDLGAQSIGWALLDETADQLLATGVRVFPEGVERDQQGGEKSKNENRRIARGMRRQIARRAKRKRLLRKALVGAGLLPEVAGLPRSDPRRGDWECEHFEKENPYSLRRRALTERLELHEIGRLLVHLNQRRGFLSNRKLDKARKKDTEGMLKEISDLAKEMGSKTLGQFLAEQQAAEPLRRLRGKHTRRDMLEAEFEAIWEAQRVHHPELLTDVLKYGTDGRRDYPQKPKPLHGKGLLEKYGIHGMMFFQRAMYWPKSVVGRCELEPKQRRCPRADRRAQRFRLFLEVNNLRLIDPDTREERPLHSDERTLLLDYLRTGKERTFEQIKKKLGMLETVRFNLERGDRNKLLGMPTDAVLAHKSLFGPAWHKGPEEEKDRIVARLLTPDVDEKETLRLATEEWELSPAAADKLLDTDLEGKENKGYSSYSLAAIEKLLPHLERGLPLMNNDDSPSALKEAGYLRPDQRIPNQRQFLPRPPEVTNPLVRQALHEVRKVVNAILRELVHRPGHRLARIHIELLREVKGTTIQRAQRTREMRDRERERDRAAEAIRQFGAKPTRDAKHRYLLWEEQKHTCIYSGRCISLHQLLGGEVDVDHILPRYRSLDNSWMNRVVCFRSENEAKGDRTPHEWLAGSDPTKFDEILRRADQLPYPKANRFRAPSIELDDFFARQFQDSAYITTQVVQYVRCLGADVVCPKGQHTAELRRHWGLNEVLRDDGLDLKNRDDHRHHAVDAIVVALTNRSRLQQLAKLYKQGGTDRTGEILNEPWANFRADAERMVNAINVSHRVQRKVSGALHKDKFYGPTPTPGVFVKRKPLKELSLNEVEHIRDEEIKRLVKKRLKQFGLLAGRKKRARGGEQLAGETPTGALDKVWAEPLRMRSGVPVNKVRLLCNEQTATPIRGEPAFVIPGSIHHICLFEARVANGQPERLFVPVSMLQAAQRVLAQQPLIQRTHPSCLDAKFLMSLSQNEMVLLTHKGKEALYRFDTAASTSGQMWFRHHTAGGKAADKLGRVSKKPGTLQARKVTVDPLGRIRWAND